MNKYFQQCINKQMCMHTYLVLYPLLHEFILLSVAYIKVLFYFLYSMFYFQKLPPPKT